MSDKEPASKQVDPLDVSVCACANLRKATRVVTQAYDSALRPSGLKATQFTLLATLASRGDLPLTRLADAMVMDRTTLTRNLKPLVAKGFVQITDGADQRVREIGLTTSGRAAYDDALPRWRDAQERFVAALGLDRWHGLLDGIGDAVAVAREG